MGYGWQAKGGHAGSGGDSWTWLQVLSGRGASLGLNGGGRGWCQGGWAGGFAWFYTDPWGLGEWVGQEDKQRISVLGFWEAGQVQGAHPVPSSCTRQESLSSSEKESCGSKVG